MSSFSNDVRDAFLSNKTGLVRGLLKRALKSRKVPLNEVLDSMIELLLIDNLYFIYKIYQPLINFLSESWFPAPCKGAYRDGLHQSQEDEDQGPQHKTIHASQVRYFR